jgi:hypothetical protein
MGYLADVNAIQEVLIIAEFSKNLDFPAEKLRRPMKSACKKIVEKSLSASYLQNRP